MTRMLFESRPTNDEELAAIERALGVMLPEDYRAFLLRHNGGRPVPDRFETIRGRGSLVGKLYPALPEDESGGLLYKAKVFKDRIPPDVITVGSDAGGNQIVLGVHGDRRGKVYFWRHEETDPPSDKRMPQIAPSFAAFIDGLSDG